MNRLQVKRAYEEALPEDGYRVLVDRLWPRGLSRERAALDEWNKELAPTTELRKWFGHDPARWAEFQVRYGEYLAGSPAPRAFVEAHRDEERITLITATKDIEHTHALTLRDHLEKLLSQE